MKQMLIYGLLMIDILLLEELTLNAWVAPYNITYDGWLLRYAQGYSRRANSVQPLYDANQFPIDDKIDYCQAFYNHRNYPTLFKLTNASKPNHLDHVLAERGYEPLARTCVQTCPITQGRYTHQIQPGAADVRTYPSTVWLDAYYEMGEVDPAHYSMARAMLSEYRLQPTYFILLWDGAIPIAAAMLVLERGYAGLYNVVVRDTYRGQGYGHKLVAYLLWLARTEEAHTAYIQVMYENLAAWKLYEAFGFRPLYDYWYRRQAE